MSNSFKPPHAAAGSGSSFNPQLGPSYPAFDDLPRIAHVRLPFIQLIYGVSRATVWRWVREGKIPAPRRLSAGVTAWNVGDIRDAMDTPRGPK